MRVLLVGLLASLALTTPLQAQTDNSLTVRISHSDLDLTTSEGVATLKQRSVKAIRRACAKVQLETIYPIYSDQRCRAAAEADAMKQIEHRRKTRLAMLTSPTG